MRSANDASWSLVKQTTSHAAERRARADSGRAGVGGVGVDGRVEKDGNRFSKTTTS